MKTLLLAILFPLVSFAQVTPRLADALTLHASFDQGFDADFSRGEKTCRVRRGKELQAAAQSEELTLVPEAGRYGGALCFPKKGGVRPQFAGLNVLNYNNSDWSGTVSVWLRLDPDKDLEPGYCDPVQIVGDDTKKGYIFLEWSKDESPRYFRYAIRPLFHLWNPTGAQWADIPFEKRPMVQVQGPVFSRAAWTHVVFSFEHLNHKNLKPVGRLHINGQARGSIENWDLTFGWDPSLVELVLGASYVGLMDDLAVFNRALSDSEITHLYQLKNGVSDLHQ